MPKLTHLKPKDFQVTPWKNGLGETIELAKDSHEPFQWRLSRAKLDQGGPFSLFPGYDRILVVIAGQGITLNHSDGKRRQLNPLEVYRFSGDLNTTSEVSAPGEDFNVLCLRSRMTASAFVARAMPDDELQLPLQAEEHFVYPLSGTYKYQEINSKTDGTMLPGDLLWISKNDTLELLNLRVMAIQSGNFIWVVIRRRA